MIPSDHLQEAQHLNLHINQERTQDLVFQVVGHISAVDPTTNKIKVVIPTWTDDNANYIESGWVPLGTAVAGNQFGIQLLPFGGATVTDPTGQMSASNGNQPAAEQVLVHVLGRKKGLYVVGVQKFNTVDVPPSGYQDKSGVQAGSGEWLFKHATGNYIYFDNTGVLTVQAYTNPAPVLQNNQQTDFPATLNLNAIADQGDTNTATVSSNISASQGDGNYNITIQSKNSTMTININGETNEYNLNVTGGTINITSDTTNVKSGTVNLGTGTMKRILTDVAAQVYNNHTHGGVMSGSSDTTIPNQPINSSDEAQNAYAS
jgi:hypothetical protein